jgi:hypothetical protein
LSLLFYQKIDKSLFTSNICVNDAAATASD